MRGVPSLLLAHLKENRIAHTYLFTGTNEEAKRAWALGFARALNCERNRNIVAVGVGFKPAPTSETCCSSCQKIEKRIHPDVHWLGEDEKARSLKIEIVRALIHEASLKPFEGRWKVFILESAERLTLEAANALLKTLEEPPEHSVFLLLVENKAHLLETIQSRAFEVRVPPAPEKDPRETPAIQILEEKGGEAFFEELRGASRAEVQEILAALAIYFRDRCVEEWGRNREVSERFLKAIERVYETLEALDANANQKLALTHLEIRLRKAVPGTSNKRTEVPGTALK